MKPLFADVAALDLACRQRYNLSEELMMEHAALAIAKAVESRADKNSKILIVTGSGNNGADGFALARVLCYEYDVAILEALPPKSELALLQKKRLEGLALRYVSKIEECDVVIDAIIGSGSNKELSPEICDVITQLNNLHALKIACDIPTGLKKDGNIDKVVFASDIVVTMGAAKTSLYSDSAKEFIKEIVTASLGVPFDAYAKGGSTSVWLLEKKDMHLPHRTNANVHKGVFGHVAVVCGIMQGAAQLAAEAALRFGAGLATIVSKEKLDIPAHLMQSRAVPAGATAICIGSGLGDAYGDEEILSMVQNCACAVLDADIFYRPILPKLLTSNKKVILTPHPKEFSSLLGLCGLGEFCTADIQSDRLTFAKLFRDNFPDIVLLLKGANSVIAYKEELFVMPCGSAALAKGGSGDVLCGLIASLLAQGYDTLCAAQSASLAHAFAAQAIECNNYALLPQDLITAVGYLR